MGSALAPCFDPSGQSGKALLRGSQRIGIPMRSKELLIASPAFVLWVLPAHAAPVNSEDAAGHVGETATVCGVVASAKAEPR